MYEERKKERTVKGKKETDHMIIFLLKWNKPSDYKICLPPQGEFI